MKTNMHLINKLLLIMLATCPIIASAAPAAGSAYLTDKSNSYVQDQTGKAMDNLNNILCYVHAMDPSEMVNLGNYIALIDRSVCSPNDSGGSGNNTGSNFDAAIVNSTQTDNASPMIAKVWIDDSGGDSGILARLAATTAPSASNPYGVFRLDYKESKQGGSETGMGYINSSASGLAFFQTNTCGTCSNGSPAVQTLKLKLNATTTTAGNGALSQTYTDPTTGALLGGAENASFYFAYDADYFRRIDINNNDVCFSRKLVDAKDSVWQYGVYDSNTGARVDRNSGFPIEYTDTITSKTMNGYIGYWGMSAPTSTISSTVYKVTYNNNSAPTKTPYTLMQTGGKLTKFTKVTSTLLGVDKIKFQFWAQNSVPSVTIPATPPTFSSGISYEAYWDNTAGQFYITGQQNPSTYNISSYATPVAFTVANMQAAAQWGLSGWSQMLGGSFSISNSAMQTLGSNTVVIYSTQDVVYPSQFAALGGMKCVSNCPTKTDIDASNLGSQTSPFSSASINWSATYNTGTPLTSYTLNDTTGNMELASVAVTSTATTGTNANGVNSGRMVAGADMLALDAAVQTRTGFPAASNYIQSDIDSLTTTYQWQTGAQNWQQLTLLKDGAGQPVTFDPPLNVNFTVPNDAAKYGTSANANIVLQFGGFGNLWGIPSTCIDVSTNAPCLPNNATPQAMQRWTPEFSIPDGSTVTVASNQTGAGTTYLVKAMNKEVRLGKVSCAGLSLTLPTAGSVTLPNATGWLDVSSTGGYYIGTMPTFTTQPAPQVIQGVKMY